MSSQLSRCCFSSFSFSLSPTCRHSYDLSVFSHSEQISHHFFFSSTCVVCAQIWKIWPSCPGLLQSDSWRRRPSLASKVNFDPSFPFPVSGICPNICCSFNPSSLYCSVKRIFFLETFCLLPLCMPTLYVPIACDVDMWAVMSSKAVFTLGLFAWFAPLPPGLFLHYTVILVHNRSTFVLWIPNLHFLCGLDFFLPSCDVITVACDDDRIISCVPSCLNQVLVSYF